MAYRPIIAKQKSKNNAAGNDLINASFILMCISIDPVSKTPSTEAATSSRLEYLMEAINTKEKLTFKKPTK